MLDPRAIAVLGIGQGAAMVARLGLLDAGPVWEAPPIQPGAFAPLSRPSSPITQPFKRRTKKRRDEEFLLF